MRRYFEQFGEILEAVVITNKFTARSKGYDFSLQSATLRPVPLDPIRKRTPHFPNVATRAANSSRRISLISISPWVPPPMEDFQLAKQRAMEFLDNKSVLIVLVILVSASVLVQSKTNLKVCYNKKNPCFFKQGYCLAECPSSSPTDKKVYTLAEVSVHNSTTRAMMDEQRR
ncbi:hypothetical protein ACFX2I_040549 [Malus domestica]